MLIEINLMTIRWRLVGLTVAQWRRDAPVLEAREHLMCVIIESLRRKVACYCGSLMF